MKREKEREKIKREKYSRFLQAERTVRFRSGIYFFNFLFFIFEWGFDRM